MSALAKLESETYVDATPQAVFDAVCDIEARARDVPAFQRVEVSERSDDGFVATMFEHYGGRDVVVTSRFRYDRPHWVSYEHVDGPYGENRGRFTIEPTGGGSRLHQLHETAQDISEGTTLRAEWLQLMAEQLDAIRRAAEGERAAN
jgi:ribosome-associated toxin RatA of RatAB toxin-antitoxin module